MSVENEMMKLYNLVIDMKGKASDLINIYLFKILFSRVWWCTPVIPALGRQRQVDF